MTDETSKQISWTLDKWMAALGHPFSIATFYNHVASGKIQIRKAGHRTLVTTSPEEFLEGCPSKLGPGPRRRKNAA